MYQKTRLAALAASVVAALAIGGTAAIAADTAPAYSPVYNMMYNVTHPDTPNTENVETNYGVTRAAYFTVTGNDGQVAQTNYAAVSSLDSSSIVDVDRAQSIALNVEASNPTGGALTLNTTDWCMPASNSAASSCGDVLLPAAQFATFTSNIDNTAVSVRYLAVGATAYQTQDEFTAAGYTPADIRAVRLMGTLAAGETVSLSVPLTITDTAKTLTYNPYTWLESREIAAPRNRPLPGNPKLRVRFRFAHRMVDANGVDNLLSAGQYIGATRDRSRDTENSQNTSHFYAVPSEIQALLPNQEVADIDYVSNDDSLNSHPASTDGALFTGGMWHIKLDRIKASLTGSGWSVNNVGYSGRFDTDPNASRLADVYGYGPAGVTDGATIDPNEDEPQSGNTQKMGPLHVELYQYIKANDHSIWTGDSYSVNDSLEWIRNYAGDTLATGNTPDLDAVTTDSQSIPESAPRPISVVSDVNNQVPGRYPVTYYLNLEDGESVSKQVTITVHPRLTFDKNSTQYGDTVEQILGQVKATYEQPATGTYVDPAIPANPENFTDAAGNMYEFTGWNSAADGSGTTFDPNLPVTQNATYYAQWKVTPAKPTDPVNPTKPTEPTKPADPSQPATPDAPAKTGPKKGKTLAKTGAAAAGIGGIALVAGLIGVGAVVAKRRQNRD